MDYEEIVIEAALDIYDEYEVSMEEAVDIAMEAVRLSADRTKRPKFKIKLTKKVKKRMAEGKEHRRTYNERQRQGWDAVAAKEYDAMKNAKTDYERILHGERFNTAVDNSGKLAKPTYYGNGRLQGDIAAAKIKAQYNKKTILDKENKRLGNIRVAKGVGVGAGALGAAALGAYAYKTYKKRKKDAEDAENGIPLEKYDHKYATITL